MKPREIAPLMGLTPNAVSALALRARDGFRHAWLDALIADPSRPEECRWACGRLVRRTRRPVSRHERPRLETHLEGCAGCTIIARDIDTASSKLRAVLLPSRSAAPGPLRSRRSNPAPRRAPLSSDHPQSCDPGAFSPSGSPRAVQSRSRRPSRWRSPLRGRNLRPAPTAAKHPDRSPTPSTRFPARHPRRRSAPLRRLLLCPRWFRRRWSPRLNRSSRPRR